MLVNNAGIFEAAPVDLPAEEWTAQWERTMRVNLTAVGRAVPARRPPFPRGRRRPDRQRRQPRRLSRRQPAALALCRVQGGDDRHDPDRSRAAMRPTTSSPSPSRPGFTASEMVEDYMASRGGQKIVADIPLGRVATAAEVAETVRWLAVDAPRRPGGDRRQRGELCPLKSSRDFAGGARRGR